MEFRVISGVVLGVNIFRGFARLCDIASISKPDIYDQKLNPTGTQRDLSPKHAREAYEYSTKKTIGFWPEVVLCARNNSIINFIPDPQYPSFGTLIIDETNLQEISISRLDGNHRLHFADGHDQHYPPVDKIVSFCIATGLTLEEELSLFRDINANQKAMNTSHLDNIEIRLSSEERLKRENPDLYIANKLSSDNESPFFNLIHKGGNKKITEIIPIRTLQSGIEYMLSRPTKLTALRDADVQYKVIKNYFIAVQKWQPDAWNNPKDFLMLRGAGLWALCFIGAEVLDRALAQNRFKTDDLLKILQSGKTWDWSKNGAFQGFSGRGGALRISNMVTEEFHNESGTSIKDLYDKILNE